MTRFRSAIFGCAAILFGASASAASAAEVYYVSSATTTAPYSEWQYLDVQGYMNDVAASGILLTFGANSPTDANQTVLTLCDDLFHSISVPTSFSPELTYTQANIAGSAYATNDVGGTRTFTASQASLLGQLVTEAQSIYGDGSAPTLYGLNNKNSEIDAIQGAIWAIEYQTTVTDPGNGAINSAISGFEGQYAPLPSGGIELVSNSGTQNQVLGIAASPAPEPAAWAVWLVGLFGLGIALRKTGRLSKAPALP